MGTLSAVEVGEPRIVAARCEYEYEYQAGILGSMKQGATSQSAVTSKRTGPTHVHYGTGSTVANQPALANG